MAVTIPCKETDTGAFPVEYPYTDKEGARKVSVVHYRKVFEGATLSLREANGYNDSDFYALVWNAEKGAPEEINYDTTRFAGGGSAFVDATDEVKAAYAAYLAHQRRLRDVTARRGASKLRFALASELAVPVAAIRRLEAAYGKLDATPVHVPSYRERVYGKQDEHSAMALAYGLRRRANTLDGVIKAAKAAKRGDKRAREFKRKLGQQVLDWLNDPAPRYATPLSPKQAQYL